LDQIRTHYNGERRELLRILLNSTSIAEANIALDVLKDSTPEKSLVSACNMREVIKAMPASPFSMCVDEQTLCKTAGLDRRMAAMGRRLDDGIELYVTTAGSMVLDVIVMHLGGKLFWNSVPVTDDYVTGDVLDLLVTSNYLLEATIDLVTSMGLVFNPKFYLSLEDWHLDNASDCFEGLEGLF
jgi:hypothetical protein